MLKRSFIVLSALGFSLFLSCGDDGDNAVTPKDGRTDTVTDIDGNVYATIKIGDTARKVI